MCVPVVGGTINAPSIRRFNRRVYTSHCQKSPYRMAETGAYIFISLERALHFERVTLYPPPPPP